MKIVTWNCNGALRKKFENLKSFNADICIIQECENPEQSNHTEFRRWATNHLWIGDNKNKGLGIFGRNNIELNALEWTNAYKDHSVKYFLPCRVNNDFDLLGVWAHGNNSPNFGYIGQLWKYLQVNKSKLNKTIIAGDLNSNAIWDQWDRWWNHSDVIRELKGVSIESLYHINSGEQQGKESNPTFYLQRKLEKAYHIDYIFGSQEFQNDLKELKIGKVERWLEISDHMPMICEF